MGSSLIAVDTDFDRIRVVQLKNGLVKKAVSVPMPQGMFDKTNVTSEANLGQAIGEVLKKNSIKGSKAAGVVRGDDLFIREITMPQMTVEQLEYNLPFEFTDYLQDEISGYLFDYAMISTPEEMEEARKKAEEEKPEEDDSLHNKGARSSATMQLLAVAVSKKRMETGREILKHAGLKLIRGVPVEFCYENLLRNSKAIAPGQEVCILDLGYSRIRMYMFKDGRFVVSRELEHGMGILSQSIADEYGVDIHLAKTYIDSNFNDCLSSERSLEVYNTTAVELLRALNFYRFSNRDSNLEDLWLGGMGAAIKPLCDILSKTLDMTIHDSSELLPEGTKTDESYQYLTVIGACLQ